MINKDYRLKENRLEGFLKYYYSIMKSEDYDPYYYTANYLFNRFELNIEQRFWMSFLYGFIYNGTTAWVVLNEFPDFENVDIYRLTNWENTNYKRMIYETDTRHKKGYIHKAFPAYKKIIGNKTQNEFFQNICDSDNSEKNFWKLWDIVIKFYLFGRYSTFFYLETLKRCNNLNVSCPSLMLRDISGSKSHRNGLCYVCGKDDWDYTKYNLKFTGYSKDMLDYLEIEGEKLLNISKETYPDMYNKFDYFSLETALCAYKGFFRQRRYLGFYLDRDCYQIKQVESLNWYGIDWGVFWDCRKENLDKKTLCEFNGYYKPRKDYQQFFIQSGQMINLNWYFPEEKYNVANNFFMDWR